jgi:hypothetical protein
MVGRKNISTDAAAAEQKIRYTISGKCVICSTFVTFTPAASRLDAVPPVEIIENLQ